MFSWIRQCGAEEGAIPRDSITQVSNMHDGMRDKGHGGMRDKGSGGMRDKGSSGAIVNVSSVASQRDLQNHMVYSSSKGALDMLTKIMALEFAPYKIRVNSVHPAVVIMPTNPKEWSDPSHAAMLQTHIPMEEEEVIILFLLSNASEMVHGAQLTIDGGLLMN
uniref:Uncharacterized protein n=1 Tax=Eptatretus burgeri TaxID=7764 RepID=A0A8C4WZA8_EPTBU